MAYSNIDKPSSYFNTIIYTGDGASPRTLTGVGFQPDLVYIRNRDQAGSWAWYDAVRGTGASKNFSTDSANAEGSGGDATGYGYLSAFNTDGFSVTTGTVAYNIVNQSTIKYSAWNWKANGTGSSNTSGTISSTVSANTTSGFSVASWTGNGSSSATVGHGLGVTPSLIINKSRSTSSAWFVYHKGLSANNFLYLNYNDAQYAISGTGGGALSTSPTSSTFGFTAGTSSVNNVNTNGTTYVTYCFADIKGFSKYGSYTGNGSTDGTFVYTGFKPAMILVKNISSVVSWTINDNKRNTFNPVEKFAYPDLNYAEGTNLNIDYLSNGFKVRATSTLANTSGNTYIYACFAENPFVSSKGIPTTAR